MVAVIAFHYQSSAWDISSGYQAIANTPHGFSKQVLKEHNRIYVLSVAPHVL